MDIVLLGKKKPVVDDPNDPKKILDRAKAQLRKETAGDEKKVSTGASANNENLEGGGGLFIDNKTTLDELKVKEAIVGCFDNWLCTG